MKFMNIIIFLDFEICKWKNLEIELNKGLESYLMILIFWLSVYNLTPKKYMFFSFILFHPLSFVLYHLCLHFLNFLTFSSP